MVYVHPCGRTAYVYEPAVDGKTFITCGGVPIWIVNDDQGPSLPSNS